MEYILQTHNLTKSYHTVKALDNLNLSLPSGKIIGLLGPNGSGKSTLIKLAAGLLCPSAGTLQIAGRTIGPETKSIVSYLPDKSYFNENQTIKELLNTFQTFYDDFNSIRAAEILKQLNLSVDSKFKTLSKGSKEKVQLALVMSRQAKLYLLDEPIAGVDPAAREYILQTIMKNYAPNATILISTHLIADVEPILDDFIFLNNGQIIRQGTVAEVNEQTGKSLDELFREVFRCSQSC